MLTAEAPADARRARRSDRWAGLRILHRASSIERVRKCRRVPRTKLIGVARRGDDAHFAGLVTCGSVWACPICSAKILAGRGDELQAAVDAHLAAGGQVAMVTLTMRHHRGDELGELWDALGHAWTAARGGHRSARQALERAGCQGWAKVTEATHGANGWHLHVHALMFIDGQATDDSAQELGDAMFTAWATRLRRDGFEPARDQGGLDVQLLNGDQAAEAVADYVTKATYGETSSAAVELVGQHGKSAGRGNRTPWAILRDMGRLGLARDHALWREWERASHGRRALTWSQGLRDRLLAEPELTDEELADDADAKHELVALIDRGTWLRLVETPNGPPAVLAAAELVAIEDGYAAVNAVLTALGCGQAIRPPPAGGSP